MHKLWFVYLLSDYNEGKYFNVLAFVIDSEDNLAANLKAMAKHYANYLGGTHDFTAEAVFEMKAEEKAEAIVSMNHVSECIRFDRGDWYGELRRTMQQLWGKKYVGWDWDALQEQLQTKSAGAEAGNANAVRGATPAASANRSSVPQNAESQPVPIGSKAAVPPDYSQWPSYPEIRKKWHRTDAQLTRLIEGKNIGTSKKGKKRRLNPVDVLRVERAHPELLQAPSPEITKTSATVETTKPKRRYRCRGCGDELDKAFCRKCVPSPGYDKLPPY